MPLPASATHVAKEPMKASDLRGNLGTLTFPVFVSPKMDGIRAVTSRECVVSKSLRPIPNVHVQRCLASYHKGLDGELIVGEPTDDPYRRSMSGIMSIDGEPNFTFWVFDNQACPGGFNERFASLREFTSGRQRGFVRVVPHYLARNIKELENYEERFIGDGYEGAMLRKPSGLYKHGRSTVNEGYLLKLKRFQDGEARIFAYSALEKNNNAVKQDAFGRTERSSHKAGKETQQALGSVTVVGLRGSDYGGVEFNVGAGFKERERLELWEARESLPGRIIKFRYFPTGAKDKPRFPTFLGFRAEGDM